MASTSSRTTTAYGPGSAAGAWVGLRNVISYRFLGAFVGAAEVGAITLGSGFGQAVHRSLNGLQSADWETSLGVGLLSSLLYVLTARSAGLYTLPALLYPARILHRTLIVCSFVLLSLTAVLFLLKIGSQFSRGSLLGFAAAMVFFSSLTRIGVAGIIEALLRRRAISGRPAFLIGEKEELDQLTASYMLRHFGTSEVGRLAVAATGRGSSEDLAVHIEAATQSAATRPQEFLVVAKWDSVAYLAEIEAALRTSPLPVRLVPNNEFRAIIGRNAPAFAENAYTVELQRAPLSLGARAAKRTLDIVVASMAVVLLTPVLVLAACAVKIDSAGPIIFQQRRNGFDRRQFVIFKFRTMRVLEDGTVVRQARRDDDRITRVGRFLRRSSIDELPQLFNVLRGDMSLVGPRPHALAHDQAYAALIGDYCLRHHVKPGITGWAQVKGCRGETAHPDQMKRRVDLDLWYIKNWSISLDMYILLRTGLEIFVHDAY